MEPALVQTLLPARSHQKDTGLTLTPQPANNVMPDVLLALTLQHALLAQESSKKMQLKAVFVTVQKGTELSVMEAASHVHQTVTHALTQIPALPVLHLSNFKRQQREQFVLTAHQTV